MAGEHLRVVLDVVGERRADPADRNHGVLHRRNASARPIRSSVVGCVPSRKCASVGGSGSETFLTAIRRWKSMNVSGSPRQLERERVRAPLDVARELVGDHGDERDHDRQRERDGRHRARSQRAAARRQALGQQRGRPHAERRDDREPDQPVAHVVVVDVAELVRDDEPRLGRREVVHERVVEHDALGAAEPGHVRVRGRGAARGVHLVDLAHVDAGLARQLEHVGAQLAARHALELVEQRIEHDRADVRRDRAERDDDDRARDPPARPEAAHAEHEHRAAERREAGADRLRLGHVARPARPSPG